MSNTTGLSKAAAQVNRQLIANLLDEQLFEYLLGSHLSGGALPPVNAFWSVTMYDGKTQLLIENPINRYLINSPMLPSLKKNPDGSITLYIQKRYARRRKGIELAAGLGWPGLRGDAALLAEGRVALDLQWYVEAASRSPAALSSWRACILHLIGPRHLQREFPPRGHNHKNRIFG